MRYACIDRRRDRYPIRLLCRLLQVSASGYYAWRVRAESCRSRYDRDLMRAIRFTHAESDGTYGSPRIHAELSAQGFACGRARVARLMHKAGLNSPLKKALLTGFHSTAKHNATKAVSPSSETMRTI